MTHTCKIKRRGERGRRERGEGRREKEEKQKPRELGREERGEKILPVWHEVGTFLIKLPQLCLWLNINIKSP